MQATKAAIEDVLDRHAPRNEPVGLRELYALVATHIDLDDEDRLSDGFFQTRWQRNVRNVLQLRLQDRTVTRPARGSYVLASSSEVGAPAPA
jgi:hypothetical protein